ncbi:MAG: oligosaccharide flippase family protein [Lachnospiraceae bacterium]|nr:oligosaccharide flippase family protein [Lachnospiraceae bacterium]
MKKKSVFSSFLSYFYGNFIVLLLGFIQTPLVTRIMSTDEYGRTGMFETAVSVIYIFAILGMDQAYIRYYYMENINRKKLMKQCLYPSVAIVSVLVVLYFVFSGMANNYLFEKSGLDITVLVAAYTLISVFERFLFLDVRMQQNGVLYSNINIAQKILNILIILGTWHFLGNDFRVVLYGMTLSWGATTLFLACRYLWLNTGKRGTGKEDGTAVYPQKDLVRYGTPFIMVLLMEWLLSSCDRIALRQWSNYSELGIYAAAMKIMVLLLTFKNTFVAFWSPVAMEKYEREESETCKAFFRQAFNVTRFFCVLAAAGLILFRQVIVFLLGADYRGADRIIPFLTLMPIFAMMFEITVQGIKFVKKNMLLNFASAAAIICNIVGNTLLVPRLSGIGAALTTGLSYIVYFAFGSYFSEKQWKVGYDFKRTALAAVMLIILAAVAAFDGRTMSVTVCGIAVIAITCAAERDSIGFCFAYAKTLLKKIRGNK